MAKGKGQRRVFTVPESQCVLTTIGANDYVIEPQPMSRYQEFQDVILQIFDSSRSEDKAGLVEWLLKIPHRFLQLYIPDITEEDAAACSLPQLKWLWETIREVNGIDWLEGLIKNALGLLSKAAKAGGQGQPGELAGDGTTMRTDDHGGETPLT